MDIYRARFVQYPTPGINALAFSHTGKTDFPTTKVDAGGRHSLRLAVGRSNGDIEIWNPLDGRWFQEVVFKGGKGRSVEGLIWTQEPTEVGEDGKPVAGALRLFSIGYSNAVTEWNLATGLPVREWAGNHSEVWCLAAQPRLSFDIIKSQKPGNAESSWIGQNIVAGCADGSLVVLTTADNDLQFQKFLTRPTTKSTRVLSLAFQNRSTLVAGFADSTVRLYDIRKGQLIRNITLGAGPKGGPKNILVWSVKVLANGDIVTGDSTGEVRFFDRKQLSQLQRIASHDADILDLAVSQKGGVVFSAGMDRRTSRYLKASTEGSKWVKTDHTTLHEHDVKALASHESEKLNVVASGGTSLALKFVDLSNWP
jgi:U3 small nucleolar RNA-associated protein 4